MHLGTSRFTGHTTTEVELLQAMERSGITHGLVMPQPTLEPTPQVHRRIYELTQRSSPRLFGMASINPWQCEEEYEREFEHCIRRYGFVAVKLHPLGHNISPLAPQCDKIYQCARMCDVPVIVHTGLGAPNALPALMIAPARRCPEVRSPSYGWMHIEGTQGNLRLDLDGRLFITPRNSVEYEHNYTLPSTWKGGGAIAAQQHFADVLRSGAPFQTEGQDYLRTQDLVEAAYRSANEGVAIRIKG